MGTSKICFFCALAVVGLGATVAMGEQTGAPCFGVADNLIVFCENFDTYCTGGNTWTGYPPFPGYCDDDISTPDDTEYLNNWLKPFSCGLEWMDRTHIVEELCVRGLHRDYNPPFSMKYEGCLEDDYCGSLPFNLASSRHEISLADAIDDQWPGYGLIGGTDSQPLYFKYHLDHMTEDDQVHAGGDSANASFYVELCRDEDRAPTNVTWVDCDDEGYTTRAVYPIICQSWARDTPTPGGFLANCPPMDTTVHSSIAVGMLALLDSNPCDLENGCRPTLYHLAFFDGVTWRKLDKGYGNPGNFEFILNDGGDAWVEVWIRTSSVYIKYVWEHCCVPYPNCSDGVCTKTQDVNEVVLPRYYLGGFNKVAFGLGAGCELNQGEHTCAGEYDCFKYGSYNDGWGWGHTWLDSLVVYNGIPIEQISPPEVETAVSCKEHDNDEIAGNGPVYCINVLDRTEDDDIEGRRYGVTTLVVNFSTDIQGVGGLDTDDVALSPAGSVDNVTLSASDELTIEMSSTTDGVPLIVTFPGIANVSDADAVCTDSVCIRQLVGDVRRDGSINAADRIDVRNQMGLDVTIDNFRADVRADGSINAGDRIDVRNVMGNGYAGYTLETCP